MEYRQEMILLGLRQRLNRENLSEVEKAKLMDEIERLESEMEMD